LINRSLAPKRKLATTIIEQKDAVDIANLVYVSDNQPGFGRQGEVNKFFYIGLNGRPIKNKAVLDRIRKLAIPPAYTDVWICPNPNGHIQATGRDAKGRKQYRYHARFREVRDGAKYEHMLEFAGALPQIRARVDQDMRQQGLTRAKVIATIVHLLETTMIRVGNEDYAKENKSYGLTTLKNRHVEIEGSKVKFAFTGKSGKKWRLDVTNRRVAKIIRASQELPGQHLFQYIDEHGVSRDVGSSDVNGYLKEISGRDISAKDFRTWTGTVLAAIALAEFEQFNSRTAAKRNIRDAIEAVASRLGNTPTICRKCYVHPEVLDSYLNEELVFEAHCRARAELADHIGALRPEEAVVLTFLQRRLAVPKMKLETA
jgi:DNA topoisomerase-1